MLIPTKAEDCNQYLIPYCLCPHFYSVPCTIYTNLPLYFKDGPQYIANCNSVVESLLTIKLQYIIDHSGKKRNDFETLFEKAEKYHVSGLYIEL